MAPAVRAALRQETCSDVVWNGALRTSRLAGRGEEEAQVPRAGPQSRGCLTALATRDFCSVPADRSNSGAGIGWLFPPGPVFVAGDDLPERLPSQKAWESAMRSRGELFSLVMVGVKLAAESRFSTERFQRQVQAKRCTRSSTPELRNLTVLHQSCVF